MISPKLLTDEELNQVQKELSLRPVSLKEFNDLNHRMHYLNKTYFSNKYKNKLFLSHLLQVNHLNSIFQKSLSNLPKFQSMSSESFKYNSLKSLFSGLIESRRLSRISTFEVEDKLIGDLSLNSEKLKNALIQVTDSHRQFFDNYLRYREKNLSFPRFNENISDVESLEAFSIIRKLSDSANEFNEANIKNRNSIEILDFTEKLNVFKKKFNEYRSTLIENSADKLSAVSALNKLDITNLRSRKLAYNLLLKIRERTIQIRNSGRTLPEEIQNDLVLNEHISELSKLCGSNNGKKLVRIYAGEYGNYLKRLNYKTNTLSKSFKFRF